MLKCSCYSSSTPLLRASSLVLSYQRHHLNCGGGKRMSIPLKNKCKPHVQVLCIAMDIALYSLKAKDIQKGLRTYFILSSGQSLPTPQDRDVSSQSRWAAVGQAQSPINNEQKNRFPITRLQKSAGYSTHNHCTKVMSVSKLSNFEFISSIRFMMVILKFLSHRVIFSFL